MLHTRVRFSSTQPQPLPPRKGLQLVGRGPLHVVMFPQLPCLVRGTCLPAGQPVFALSGSVAFPCTSSVVVGGPFHLAVRCFRAARPPWRPP